MLNFDERNVIVNLQADDSKEVIKKLVERMEINGNVKKEYYDACLEREKQFPTGLPTEGIRVAIPHASSESIILSGVAVALLEKPVIFNNMANPEEKIDVEIVFLIANANESEQAKDLQTLMECFSDKEALLKIYSATTPYEVVRILKKYQN
ncbi:PTS sugar transporter subunit IIA [Clostridium sediminicola]|uniref:PTS sugar transporter subunit IIA n=1 Tax=Clostridium sediminicola TaxID=3114879 RepID=UPI0031F23C8A